MFCLLMTLCKQRQWALQEAPWRKFLWYPWLVVCRAVFDWRRALYAEMKACRALGRWNWWRVVLPWKASKLCLLFYPLGAQHSVLPYFKTSISCVVYPTSPRRKETTCVLLAPFTSQTHSLNPKNLRNRRKWHFYGNNLKVMHPRVSVKAFLISVSYSWIPFAALNFSYFLVTAWNCSKNCQYGCVPLERANCGTVLHFHIAVESIQFERKCHMAWLNSMQLRYFLADSWLLQYWAIETTVVPPNVDAARFVIVKRQQFKKSIWSSHS